MINSTDKLFYPRHVLRQVEKPAQYLGQEWNMVDKSELFSHELPDDHLFVHFGFCFPDIYEIGMSNMALSIIYNLLNSRSDTWCERFFSPEQDMRRFMQELAIPLVSLESKTPMHKFDLIGFTLQYELSFVTILDMLHLGGIPIRCAERSTADPIVIAGGPIVYNPEPLADFIDLFIIGDGEDLVQELIDLYKSWDKSQESRQSFLLRCAKIEGIYVPSYYEAVYYDDGRFKSLTKLHKEVPSVIKKRIVKDLSLAYSPTDPIVPNTQIVHDRAYLELFRGCPRGCRFCQAGIVYRPVRERSAAFLVEQAKQLLQSTGYGQLGLLSLSTGDYSELEELGDKLIALCSEKNINLSLPSLRLDSFSFDLMKKASTTRKTGLTFAPEAGSQRLRDIINKDIQESDLLEAVKIAFEGGWNTIKLYFMLGLPFENEADVLGIADLTEQVLKVYDDLPLNKRKRKPRITISTSFFIPKPGTPFQWSRQINQEQMAEKQAILANNLRMNGVKYQWHDYDSSIVQGIISRGDRKIGQVIEEVWRNGGWLESWTEFFSYDRWLDAMDKFGLNINFYTSRERKEKEQFPWDHISSGVTKSFLWKEFQKAQNENLTGDCREMCSQCGVSQYKAGVCLLHGT